MATGTRGAEDAKVSVPNDDYTEFSSIFQEHPLPHPEPAHRRTVRARDACSEALSYIAAIQDELSTAAGTKPERRPEWWLHHLRLLTGHLLLCMEDEDAARH